MININNVYTTEKEYKPKKMRKSPTYQNLSNLSEDYIILENEEENIDEKDIKQEIKPTVNNKKNK